MNIKDKGRGIAEKLGIKIIGVLGILIQAKKERKIEMVKPYILKLIDVGFRLNKKLINKVLKALNEEDL